MTDTTHLTGGIQKVDAARFNLAEYVLQAGLQHPDKTALEIMRGDQSTDADGAREAQPDIWTYARLRQAILGCATGLRAAGLRPGDRVMLRLSNDVVFPIAYLGAIAAGVLPVPTPFGMTQSEVDKLQAALGAHCAICSPKATTPLGIQCITDEEIRGFFDLAPHDFERGDAERPAYIVLTSGTSGMPRLVVHAHRAILGRRYMWAGWYDLRPTDRLAHAGAFNWTYTLGTGLLDPWSIGASALVPAPGTAPADLPALLRQNRATLFAGAPGVFRQMLRNATGFAYPELRHGLTAGEKCPETTKSRWQEVTGTPLHEAFGQSEVSTFISGSPARPAPPGTLGYGQKGRHVAIVDANGKSLPPDTAGSIAISASDPGLMLGLWRKGAIEPVQTRAQWYLTGDIGRRTPDGAITYLGRDDDMLNAGGFRVSPVEVEDCFTTLPEISEAAAIEERVKLDASVIALVYHAEAPLDEERLHAHARTHLAPHKRPRIFRHSPPLPRSANGKLLRRAIRQA